MSAPAAALLVLIAATVGEVVAAGQPGQVVEPDRIYFGIAAPAAPGQPFARAFNKTLANMTQSMVVAVRGGVPIALRVEMLHVELPSNGSFSGRFLQELCERLEARHVAGMLVLGESPAAFTAALASGHAGVPVLWARGGSALAPGLPGMDLRPLEVLLEPTSRELVEALRSLFLQTHWHSFTVVVDDSATALSIARSSLWSTLAAQPLNPTLVRLSPALDSHSIFRRLAEISRSTRGVVVLVCSRLATVRIFQEARKLNMADGHFVWLWVDTAPSNATTAPAVETPGGESDHPQQQRSGGGASAGRRRTVRSPRPDYVRDAKSALSKEFVESDLGIKDVSYLLRNDRFLLFNDKPDGSRARRGADEYDYYDDSNSNDDNDGNEPNSRAGDGKGAARARRESAAGRRSDLMPGLLSIRPNPIRIDRHLVKGAVRLMVNTLRKVLAINGDFLDRLRYEPVREKTSCWRTRSSEAMNFSKVFARELRTQSTDALAGKPMENNKVDKSLVSNFEISNLVTETLGGKESIDPDQTHPDNARQHRLKWRPVGHVTGRSVQLDTIVWPGGDIVVSGVSSKARSVFRVVTALAPPFVMESELDEDGQCLRGLPCHRVLTSDKDNLTLVFNEMETEDRLEEEGETASTNYNSRNFAGDYSGDTLSPFKRFKTNCCYGLAMDLLENVAQELEFDFHLYIAADGLYGSPKAEKRPQKRDVGKKFLSLRFDQSNTEVHFEDHFKNQHSKWSGIVGDLVSGAAHMSFAPLSVSSARSEVIDFSTPYFFSGVSFLAAPQQKSEIPLMAFLLPFSPELWIAIFTSLNITAIAVAVYEWLSPFGLNPWGRQRSKNFSMSSALWVMWGLLCGHLVAFKAPKSWPNKFLINVWGGFSVIFVASYTANIAALIAGLFFHNTVGDYHDRSLLSQKVGAPRDSAAEYYVQRANHLLWDHMRHYRLESVEDGVQRLRNGSLDILIADTPILDYYRATDHGCKLQKIGDSINEDTYAVGMAKGFPLKDSISAVIAKYANNGYMDLLQEKWYGGLACFKVATDMAQPRPLGVAAVTGVFILLGVGMIMGCLILLVEHIFYKYTLPILRHKPKGTIWRSRNIMFFSQKLYRFINCVELVSPHHAARELVHTLRQGQITSLFQKSIKRKEHEQRRRRRSKAQFFEMIQEIRRQQKEEREQPLASLTELDAEYQASPEDRRPSKLSPNIIRRTFMRSSPRADQSSSSAAKRSPAATLGRQLFSPRSKGKAKSATALNVRRFSTDSVFNTQTSTMLRFDHNTAVGRRLSKDAAFLSSSPPDMNSRRSSYLDIIRSGGNLSGRSPVLSIENVSDCGSINSKRSADNLRKYSDAESIGRKLATLPKRHTLEGGRSEETLNVPEDATSTSRQSVSDEEVTKRSLQQQQLLAVQTDMQEVKVPVRRSQSSTNGAATPQPSIKIQVEDTSKQEPPARKKKSRHRSLGDAAKSEDASKRPSRPEHSNSLDNPLPKSRSSSTRCQEHDLPPAPPPPNCSPRNSDGRSPLERLSKEELVLLWRSSESELRSHLLKAIRDKEVDDPP